jgi:hypothetical protein
MRLSGPKDEIGGSSLEYERRLARYSLLDPLIERRSRRFATGMSLNGGPLTYDSVRSQRPLSLEEESALAFAACGITGYALAGLPYEGGEASEAGGGNIMTHFVGRTVPSGDAMHDVTLFVLEDEGTWMLKRPQDYPRSEIAGLARTAMEHRLVELYEEGGYASPGNAPTCRASCPSWCPSTSGRPTYPARLLSAVRRMLRPLHQHPALGLRGGLLLLCGRRAQPLQAPRHRPIPPLQGRTPARRPQTRTLDHGRVSGDLDLRVRRYRARRDAAEPGADGRGSGLTAVIKIVEPPHGSRSARKSHGCLGR